MCDHTKVWTKSVDSDEVVFVSWIMCGSCYVHQQTENFKPNKQTCVVCGHLSLSYECKHVCREIAKIADFIDEK